MEFFRNRTAALTGSVRHNFFVPAVARVRPPKEPLPLSRSLAEPLLPLLHCRGLVIIITEYYYYFKGFKKKRDRDPRPRNARAERRQWSERFSLQDRSRTCTHCLCIVGSVAHRACILPLYILRVSTDRTRVAEAVRGPRHRRRTGFGGGGAFSSLLLTFPGRKM